MLMIFILLQGGTGTGVRWLVSISAVGVYKHDLGVQVAITTAPSILVYLQKLDDLSRSLANASLEFAYQTTKCATHVLANDIKTMFVSEEIWYQSPALVRWNQTGNIP